MCAIAGWLSWTTPPSAELVTAMCAAQRHRGPDAAGIAELGPIVLGHQRLSVIDVEARSNQPFINTECSHAIVYNGELYNFKTLRDELAGRGKQFTTSSDTEVVLEAYKAWGPDCLHRFNGMFAFAVWDIRARRLFLARDRTGEKPLYYAELPDGGLAFSSELHALRGRPGIEHDVDPTALHHYLALNYTSGERTLARGIRRLAPAHFLVIDGRSALKIKRYWDLAARFREKPAPMPVATAEEQLRALIDDAVRIRMVSDVPLGAFLSGGVDSSTIVASMVRHVSPSSVRTFSAGFNEASYSEIEQAKTVASHLGVRNDDTTLDPTTDDVIAALRHSAREPIGDSSFLPTWQLSRFARRAVTVALSGDGGDEAFGGYTTYSADALKSLLDWVPAGWARAALRFTERVLPPTFRKVAFDEQLRRFLAGFTLPTSQAHCAWRVIFDARDRLALLNPELRGALHADDCDPFAVFEPHYREVEGCHPLDQSLYVDIKTWMTDDILVKVDRASMAHSLEVRAPLLDHRLLEFAAGLPPNWKHRAFRGKWLLRRSQARRLPGQIVRGRKLGFNAPVSHWISGPLRDFIGDVIAQRRLREWLDGSTLDLLWREHEQRRKDNGMKLLGVIGLALWLAPT